MAWEHGHTEQFALSLPSATEEVQMGDLEAVSWATDRLCPWQSQCCHRNLHVGAGVLYWSAEVLGGSVGTAQSGDDFLTQSKYSPALPLYFAVSFPWAKSYQFPCPELIAAAELWLTW